eukprot:PITA_18817
MLWMHVMDQQNRWEEILPLVEFAYNNSYHSSIKMAPFEFLYVIPCITPLSWDQLEDQVLIGPEVVQEMEEQMTMIRGRLKEAQDRQKIYVVTHQIDRSYEVEDRVFLKVRPQKSSIRFGKGEKLSLRFMGPFEILERKDPSHVINLGHLQVSNERTTMIEPFCILDQRTLQLRKQLVDRVKVQWDNYCPGSATWEDAEEMRHCFPYVFQGLRDEVYY